MFGLASFIPGISRLSDRATGGTSSAFYCYSTWLRHRRFVVQHGFRAPSVVAELGPGDSLGTGLAALLSGGSRYHAFDIVDYADQTTNLRVLDELIDLFRARTHIASCVYSSPALRNTDFPDDIDIDELTSPGRIEAIRAALTRIGAESNGFLVSYEPEWTTQAGLLEEPDLIFSQAVLEHVDDLPAAYAAMHRWLKHGGCISHEIDFTSHHFARAWNGHWSFSDREWKLIRGRRRWAINREPLSTHLELLKKAGFTVVDVQHGPGPPLDRAKLDRRFSHLTDTDLTTASAYVLARKE
jgi:SAM-dependent methyltransferase